MFKTANLTFIIFLLLLANLTYAQPNCALLLTPNDGAVEQELTVTLTWQAPSSGEIPTSYNVYWGENQGSLNLLGNTTGFEQNISTSQLGTTFYWSIEALGPGGASMGCSDFTYTTLDIPVAPVIDCGGGTPVDVVFDLESQTGWTGDIGTSNQLWKFNTGGTNSSNTGPLQGQAGLTSQYLYYEASGSSGTAVDVSAISPAIDLTTASGDVALTFYMHAFGGGIHMLDVAVGTSATGPFTSIWSWDGAFQSMQDEDWVLVGLDLSAYTGETIFLNFSNIITPSGGGLGDLAIDEIEIHGCEVSNSTNNTCASATVLAQNGESGNLTGQVISGASDSGLGTTVCSVALPTADVFYSIETDIDGGGIIIDLTSPAGANMHMALYQGNCGSLTEVACASAAVDGEDITLNYFDDELRDNGDITTRSAAETYFLRVFDLNESAEAFSLNASGSGLAALPVELITWKAELKMKSVELQWETAQETNTDKFTVQKSYDGQRWMDIADIKANGFTSSHSAYSFEDMEIVPVQYYRLYIVDFDGYTEHSSIISISRDDVEINIFPNPVVNSISIQQDNFIHERPTYEIYDYAGKRINASTLEANLINVDYLTPGFYSLIIRDGNQVYTTKFKKN